MSNPYVGEIRCFGFNFAPYGWMQCNGQLLPINSYQALFAIIGTYYGGNGTTNFALPNLQGQAPMHWGTPAGLPATVIGETQGTATVTLTSQQIPQHTHQAVGAIGANAQERTATPGPTTYIGGSKGPDQAWLSSPTTLNAPFAQTATSIAGGSLPHDNMQPYIAMNFCIALNGIFPSRN